MGPRTFWGPALELTLTTAPPTTNPAVSQPKPRLQIGHFRWVICGLLLLGTTKNYMDRQVLGLLKTTLQHSLGWNEIQYSNIVVAFQAAYAVGMLLTGWFIDKVGTRIGYALAMVFWSLASMGHAIASSLFGFITARAALGLGEAANFPAGIRSVAEWFPQKERALATGIFNAGTNVGAILTPLFVPWVAVNLGWRWAFLITGSLGFAWLVLWLLVYQEPDKHPRCSAAELEYIRSDAPQPVVKMRWREILGYKQTWMFALGKFLTDPIWWFYLFWIPDFLEHRHGLHLTQVMLPLVTIYLISDIGSVGGGWLSSFLIRQGFSVNAGRKIALLAAAISILPIIYASRVSGLWPAVIIIGIAASGHQAFSANLFTLTSDMFPTRAVGSVVGFGGMLGAIGGMCISKVIGYLLQWTGSYLIPFFIAGFAYLVALGVMHLLNPKLEPALIGRES